MLKINKILAPAKVNFSLHVLGKRGDGFHELAMLMVPVSLYDLVEVRISAGQGVRVDCPGVSLAAGERNLAGQAAQLLLEHVGLDHRVDISITKNIPVAAGLGGGSSDAATVLLALDRLLDLRLSKHELMALGLRLGADVPFFLFGKTAWATGVGERLQAWPGLPPFWLVLVNPRVAVSTAAIFANLRLTRTGSEASIPRFPDMAESLVPLLHNDLETVTCRLFPVITTIKQRLVERGALGALMSGSGPTVFGVFSERQVAVSVSRELAAGTGWWTAVVAPC